MGDNGVGTNIVKKYKCTFEGCDFTFQKPSHLKWHMNNHLNIRPYKCEFKGCDKSYSNPSHLNRHALNHSTKLVIKKYMCKYCSGYFSNLSNMKRHIARLHNERSKYCCECKIRFKKDKFFQEHMKIHSTGGFGKKFECEQCGSILSNLDTFHKHLKKHANVRYQCPYNECGAEFYTIALRREHEKLFHVRTYKCADCEKTFLHKYNLKIHILLHIGPKQEFRCGYKKCNRVYNFKRNLNHHIQLVHMNKRLICEICKYGYSTKQKLRQHIENVHQKKPKENSKKLKGIKKKNEKKI